MRRTPAFVGPKAASRQEDDDARSLVAALVQLCFASSTLVGILPPSLSPRVSLFHGIQCGAGARDATTLSSRCIANGGGEVGQERGGDEGNKGEDDGGINEEVTDLKAELFMLRLQKSARVERYVVALMASEVKLELESLKYRWFLSNQVNQFRIRQRQNLRLQAVLAKPGSTSHGFHVRGKNSRYSELVPFKPNKPISD
ncbi:50S ribosomal protein L29, chloroplastic-like [Canna indica]|uniref:50S ribosomal protein L29, chloroplastic-like n=1 Tax=Canna indica TaxID=4628 RepID=A0AAQ3Q0A7_9LILI|nr:50S ribosomal protein L29, chloroplastic-like [Canna indica]